MEKLAEALGLTTEQREKLKTKLEGLEKSHLAAMKDHHGAMQKHMKAMGEAFMTDKFDAKKVGVGEKFGEMIKMMMKGRIAFVEAVLSVLTPEQRSKFAEHLRQHSDMGED
jgi:Spy/CpxP family protein refolding chaperone